MDAMRPSAVFEIPTGESKSPTGMEIAEELVDKSDRNVMPPSAYLCNRPLIQRRPSDARPKHTKGSGSPGDPSNPSCDTSPARRPCCISRWASCDPPRAASRSSAAGRRPMPHSWPRWGSSPRTPPPMRACPSPITCGSVPTPTPVGISSWPMTGSPASALTGPRRPGSCPADSWAAAPVWSQDRTITSGVGSRQHRRAAARRGGRACPRAGDHQPGGNRPSPWRSAERSSSSPCRVPRTMTCRSRPGRW
jgi:hypothetical protein